jgi:hypothetical protein
MDTEEPGVRFPAEAPDFPLLRGVQIAFGAHPAYHSQSTWGSFAVRKLAEACSLPLTPLSSVEVKNAWTYTSTPPHVFTAWA